jgi:uncharacterized Zn finger protein
MAGYYGGWAPYVPVAKRRRQAQRTVAKLSKTGHPVAPVTIEGRKIATTFWGRAWCDNMESYRDYESRLPRGRSYVRNGSVVDLQVAPGRVTAMVSGSELYHVTITVKETAKSQWQAICRDCAGGIDSLVELLQGRLSQGVMERLCRQQGGLFPRPSDIRFSCSCPDHASMCKHVAAALYGIGARLDHQPELLFRLRAVDETGLIAGIDKALPLPTRGRNAGKLLESDDVSALFGLEIAPSAIAPGAPPVPRRVEAVSASATGASGAKAATPKRSAATPGPAVSKARGGAPRQKRVLETPPTRARGSRRVAERPQDAPAPPRTSRRSEPKPVKWW